MLRGGIKEKERVRLIFFWRIGGINPGFERIFLRLLFGGKESTFQRRSETDFFGELEESVHISDNIFRVVV